MQRFSAIDGLRFWMAWWVIADHIFLATGARRYVSPQVADFIEHGNWAVQLFMIISGFVITHVILSRKDTYQTYIIQRFFRLYPLYVVAMIAAISVRDWDASVWADSSYIADPLRAINRIASENTYPMLHAILHVTMFHGVVPDDRLAYASSAFLPPAWSLSVEWQFYLVAPLLLRVLIKPSPLGWFLAALGIATSLVTTFGSYAWWQYLSFLPQALPYFIIGVVSQLAIRRQLSISVIIILLVALFIGGFSTNIYHSSGFLLVLTIWIFYLVLSLYENNSHFRWHRSVIVVSKLVATHRLYIYLGKISYSSYLIRVPILTLFLGFGRAVTGSSDDIATLSLAIASIPTIIAASALFYHFVEVPGIRLGRAIYRQRNGYEERRPLHV